MEVQQTNNNRTELYLAPVQGFTDVVYRRAYNEIFSGIDAYFIPYISAKNMVVIKKYEKEILRINNPQKRVVPQVLARNSEELLFLADYLVKHGYTEINLNLGCPYPMVTNRGQGAGLLPHPEKMEEMLLAFYRNFNVNLSVKMRAGLNSSEEIKNVIPVLNDFPVSEIIFHPRTAKQLYSGAVNYEIFDFASRQLKHKLVYNGNIFSLPDFESIKNRFPSINTFMLGRGVLQNPFLPGEFKNEQLSAIEKVTKLAEFHRLVFESYSEWMDNEGNLLNKMKQFWVYFEGSFSDGEKILKRLNKIRSLSGYKAEITSLFQKFA